MPPARIYLDHNASAPLRPEAIAAREEAGGAGNASSVHWAGRRKRNALDTARERVAGLLGARPSEIVFTSGGSESNALALWGAFLGRREPGRVRVLVSAIEHPSVLQTAAQLARAGAQVELLPVGADGRLDLDRARGALGPDVALAALMLANNETGAVQPVAEFAREVRAHGAIFHCDAVQAAGRIDARPAALGADLLAISGHKLGAGTGAGVLFVRDGVPIAPIAAGHQEGGRRAGTEDVPSCAAFAAAFAAAEAERSIAAPRLAALRDRLEAGLRAVPDATFAASEPRLPNTVNACFRGAAGEALLIALDLEGIAASSGAACASGTLEPSHVLLAMGVPPEVARGSLRFSLGPGNTEAEVDAVLALLPDIVRAAREADAVE